MALTIKLKILDFILQLMGVVVNDKIHYHFACTSYVMVSPNLDNEFLKDTEHRAFTCVTSGPCIVPDA